MNRFEIGETYCITSICDHGCTWDYKVTHRTAVTVWLAQEGEEGELRRKLRVSGNDEVCDPEGRYSMSPVLRASKKVLEVV